MLKCSEQSNASAIPPDFFKWSSPKVWRTSLNIRTALRQSSGAKVAALAPAPRPTPPHPPPHPPPPSALPPLFLRNPLSSFPVLGPARLPRRRAQAFTITFRLLGSNGLSLFGVYAGTTTLFVVSWRFFRNSLSHTRHTHRHPHTHTSRYYLREVDVDTSARIFACRRMLLTCWRTT